MRQGLQWFIHRQGQGLRTGDEHPAYTRRSVYYSFTCLCRWGQMSGGKQSFYIGQRRCGLLMRYRRVERRADAVDTTRSATTAHRIFRRDCTGFSDILQRTSDVWDGRTDGQTTAALRAVHMLRGALLCVGSRCCLQRLQRHALLRARYSK